jgi:hypothetical protein
MPYMGLQADQLATIRGQAFRVFVAGEAVWRKVARDV